MAVRTLPSSPTRWLQEDCCGCLIIQVRRDQADITCDECGSVVGIVLMERASAVMLEMVSTAISIARCTHCGALNTFPAFSAIEEFTCSECSEGVVVHRSVQ